MIKKWSIQPGESVTLPPVHEVLHVGRQGTGYFYWTNDSPPNVTEGRGRRTITLLPTGATPEDGWFHLGSFVDETDGTVWHLFQDAV